MMFTILIFILLFLGIGIIAGALFSYTSLNPKNMGNPETMSTRLSEGLSHVPGFDCGACSYDTCFKYINAIIQSNERPDRCVAGGTETTNSLVNCMKISHDTGKIKQKAYIACNSGIKISKNQFPYDGLQSCSASFSFYGGMRACKSGCLGFGSCLEYCPTNAIHLNSDGLAVINQKKCNGCGICIKDCPIGIIRLAPSDASHYIACASESKPEKKMSICDNSCIACFKCEKTFGQGFEIRNNLAQIKWNSSESIGSGISICPTQVIKQFDDIK